MIEVKLSDILAAKDIFIKLSNGNFPIAYAYKISKLIGLLEVEMQNYYKAQDLVIQKYGERDVNGKLIIENGSVPIIPEKVVECDGEIRQLLDITVQINADPIPLSQISGLNMTPRELIYISKFITE